MVETMHPKAGGEPLATSLSMRWNQLAAEGAQVELPSFTRIQLLRIPSLVHCADAEVL